MQTHKMTMIKQEYIDLSYGYSAVSNSLLDDTPNGDYLQDDTRGITWGVKCFLPNCNTSKRNTPRARFFRFPKHNAELFSRWMIACGYRSLPERYNRYLCHKHFDPSCFGKRRLKADSIPTLNMPKFVTLKDYRDEIQLKREYIPPVEPPQEDFVPEEEVTAEYSEIEPVQEESQYSIQNSYSITQNNISYEKPSQIEYHNSNYEKPSQKEYRISNYEPPSQKEYRISNYEPPSQKEYRISNYEQPSQKEYRISNYERQSKIEYCNSNNYEKQSKIEPCDLPDDLSDIIPPDENETEEPICCSCIENREKVESLRQKYDALLQKYQNLRKMHEKYQKFYYYNTQNNKDGQNENKVVIQQQIKNQNQNQKNRSFNPFSKNNNCINKSVPPIKITLTKKTPTLKQNSIKSEHINQSMSQNKSENLNLETTQNNKISESLTQNNNKKHQKNKKPSQPRPHPQYYYSDTLKRSCTKTVDYSYSLNDSTTSDDSDESFLPSAQRRKSTTKKKYKKSNW